MDDKMQIERAKVENMRRKTELEARRTEKKD